MMWKQVPRWLRVIAGVLLVCGGAPALLQNPERAERCERLMTAFENADQQDKIQAIDRLDAGCWGWESMR